ncbi:MAG: bifunctional phosphoribosyl-AMP cyclohydrolase/phosphoribosyl-ATP diphosphatase HisIE [Vulcanimicrobiaceae bacterium]
MSDALPMPDVAWPESGLIPVVIIDEASGDVLTLAYANHDALAKTVATGSTWLYSRSRGALWNKGETSGHTQRVVSLAIDCDRDALIYRVVPNGPACHTGARSCFSDLPDERPDEAAHGRTFALAMSALAATIAERKANAPEGSYTAKLFAGGVDRIGKKIGEEATEVVIAAKNPDRGELIWETADLLYHTLVLMAERSISLDEVGAELSRRAAPTP